MLALALEGGGARGAFSIGAVKALMESGYEFDAVAGTSIGALNGALIAQGDWKICYDWWKKLDVQMLFDLDTAHVRDIINRKIDKQTFEYFVNATKAIIENRGMDVTGVRDTLKKLVDEKKLRESPVEFGMVTVSMHDFKPLELFKEDIPEGRMIDYLMASANIPVFKLEPIDGAYYIDGGFYDNCPVNLLCSRAKKDIIAVRTHAIGITRKVEYSDANIVEIEPSEELGNILYFDRDTIDHDMQLGYCDAMRVICGLKGKKYYVRPSNDRKKALKMLLKIPEAAVASIALELHLTDGEPRRLLFERIIPAVAKHLATPANATYEDIVVSILEKCAERRGLNRLEVRDFDSFMQQLRENHPDEGKPVPLLKAVAQALMADQLHINDYAVIRMGEEMIKAY